MILQSHIRGSYLKVRGKQIPVQLFTDNKSLFDVISESSQTSKKRSMLDIATAREGFREKLISGIGFVRGNANLADRLTKAMIQAVLRNVFMSGYLEVQPKQWIVR